jgi:Tol biopolymer transport system component
LFAYGSITSSSGIVSLDSLSVDALPPFLDWHPDGLRYLWGKPRPDAFEISSIGIYDLRNGTTTTLLTGGRLSNPRFSSDGTMVVATDFTQNITTKVVDLSGQLVMEAAGPEAMHLSHDGEYAVVESEVACGKWEGVFATRGAKLVHCFGIGTGSAQPAWSPVANLLAFTKTRPLSADPATPDPVTNDVYLLDAESLGERLIASDIRGHLNCFTWSPDSRFVVLHACGL